MYSFVNLNLNKITHIIITEFANHIILLTFYAIKEFPKYLKLFYSLEFF